MNVLLEKELKRSKTLTIKENQSLCIPPWYTKTPRHKFQDFKLKFYQQNYEVSKKVTFYLMDLHLFCTSPKCLPSSLCTNYCYNLHLRNIQHGTYSYRFSGIG